ncbi:hypothetical protein CTheo_5641 [Ceratobasidium theobromae]|uniref:Uncharacterized protein n=1 Tax=Ceratobasidium theobromae TaxID=1582974 RepID=A0A5N5QGN7_9AGAM|nr:hypothetical protein CTheo_5641 [Ceratobasidium theobromae]
MSHYQLSPGMIRSHQVQVHVVIVYSFIEYRKFAASSECLHIGIKPRLIVALVQSVSFYLGPPGFSGDDPVPIDLRVEMTHSGRCQVDDSTRRNHQRSQPTILVLESPTSLIDQPDLVDKYDAEKFNPARKDDPEKEPEF